MYRFSLCSVWGSILLALSACDPPPESPGAGGGGAGSAGSSSAGGQAGQGGGGPGGTGAGTGASTGCGPQVSQGRASIDGLSGKSGHARRQRVQSYTFSVHVEATVPPSHFPMALDDRVRLDLREVDGTWQAAFTPERHGGGLLYPVDVGPPGLTLTQGAGGLHRQFDAWSYLSVSLDSLKVVEGSRFPGQVEIEGTYSTKLIDTYGPGGLISTRVELTPDTIAPTFTPTMVTALHPLDPFLPWDLVAVRASEGVPGPEWRDALSLTATGGCGVTPITAPWQLEAWTHTGEPPAEAWAGYTDATLRSDQWDALSGSTLRLSIASGVPDLMGNTSESVEAEVPVLAVPGPAASHDFEAPTLSVGTWGDVRLAAAGSPEAEVCESGGCLLLGPFKSTVSLHGLGLAARLSAQPGQTLKVRSRTLSSPNFHPVSPQGLSLSWTPRVSLYRALHPSSLSSTTDFTPLPVPFGELSVGSPWRTTETPLDAPTGGEIGVVLSPGHEQMYWGPTGDPMRLIVVERIWVE